MDLQEQLDSAKKSIFRFEFFQDFRMKDEEDLDKRLNEQFLKTGDVEMSLMKEWHDYIKLKTDSGVEMKWVRLVVAPMNFYTKLSLHIYRKRVKYGIGIFIITKEEFDKLKINAKDFYLIDDENVLLMNYDKTESYYVAGDFLGVRPDNEELNEYLNYKKLLLENSLLVADFEAG